MGKPFTKLCFVNSRDADNEYAILDLVESNEHLKRLEVTRGRISGNNIVRLCSAAHNHHSLVELSLEGSLNDPGIGNATLTSLLTSGGFKLERLDLGVNNITSDVSMILADFLAANPRLKILQLYDNLLNDNDAALIANALRTNTTLRYLGIVENNFTDIGFQAAFLPVLRDESSLNALADSNHTCHVPDYLTLGFRAQNSSEVVEENRARKIYCLLSKRNVSKTMSNVQYFGDIDVKILPNMFEVVQKYSNFVNEDNLCSRVESLSIVFEVMLGKCFQLVRRETD